jgi:hypothetical protein
MDVAPERDAVLVARDEPVGVAVPALERLNDRLMEFG